MSTTLVNEKVTITALSFTGKNELRSYPRRMEFRGQNYTFVEAGLRCLVRSRQKLAQIVTMNDGTADYRLRLDATGSDWTLVSISQP